MLTLSHKTNLLLTGLPGCGKTTAIRRLVERLASLLLAGFYTEELREGGNRVGFEAVGLSTRQHALLAHIRSRSGHRVGRYGVETAALAQVVEAELVPPRRQRPVRRPAVGRGVGTSSAWQKRPAVGTGASPARSALRDQ